MAKNPSIVLYELMNFCAWNLRETIAKGIGCQPFAIQIYAQSLIKFS